ncbi:MMPL family transporter [Nonomuraea sp. PA05]|uniref:MMPL family transporter n=1 Tax=Nonomuraea sp. PA05 TaxID=2604466 RepID=UPI0011D37CD4|nr:MMPL family transporter [Nonomuraea sp. PA05]TYB50768.1 MMPL family transporter [Nonomuraea sp. PA05]
MESGCLGGHQPEARGLLARAGTLVLRMPRLVVAAALLTLLVTALAGGALSGGLRDVGFSVAGGEADRAARLLADGFAAGEPDLVVVARAGRSVDLPAERAAGVGLTRAIAADPGVAAVTSHWTASGGSALRSRDGRAAQLLVRLRGDGDARRATARRLTGTLGPAYPPLTLMATGAAHIANEVEDQSRTDMLRAEAVAVPLTALILIAVFGGVVSASFPLAVGLCAVAGTVALLGLLAGLLDISHFALNMSSMLGLGLAVDYSLILLTRYREERGRGRCGDCAVRAMMATAGRTVVFSAVAVGLSLAALLVFPTPFVRSLAVAGLSVVLLSAVMSLALLPALLKLFGRWIDRGRIPWRRRHGPGRDPWGVLVGVTMRRPWPVLVTVTLALVLCAVPFTRASFGLPDDRVLPASSTAHQAAEDLRTRFPEDASAAIAVVLPGAAADGRLDAYAAALSRQEGVRRVETATGGYADGRQTGGDVGGRQDGPAGGATAGGATAGGAMAGGAMAGGAMAGGATAGGATAAYAGAAGAWVRVVPVSPAPERNVELVSRLRALPSPAPALVGGRAAVLLDTRQALAERLPWALALIAGIVMALLFAFTGSVLVPVKAVALSALSLTAGFGLIVHIFQDGNLRWLVGDFTVTGTIDINAPLIVGFVAFGLSLDYEFFILSKIKELHDATGDNARAVAEGVRGTATLVTSAGAVLVCVLLALVTSGITALKLTGLGLALAVLVDATLIRGLLLPAFMRLAGEANWWAPARLRRLPSAVPGRAS